MFTIGWKRPYDRFDGSKILLLTFLNRMAEKVYFSSVTPHLRHILLRANRLGVTDG